ncbi:MAG TPA: carboxypeptidase regulatory-like domain-containing protein, partial [Gemmataceae bacterium]|nr:carboxypeptidase regulatory-like domain-containing protein [Gemmataceae bacterium]
PLGGWLFAVAHRVAVRCRADAYRRKARETEAATRKRATVELPDLSWREAAAVLHEELNALPDKYRLPLLLCSVQGLARDEAAEQLGTTVGAIRGQLERGRTLLERRLTRRGVVLSAGLLAVLVGSSRAAALPPVGLIDQTVRAAGGHASAGVVALTHGAFPMTAMLKHAALPAVLILGLIGVGLGVGPRPLAASADEKPAKAAKPDATKTTGVGGTVVGADGKPIAAELILLRPNGSPESLGKANADGTFKLSRPLPEHSYLLARADGHGVAFVSASRRTPAEVAFKLTKDNPIRGRVIDTQGKPVAGATVFPLRLDDYGRQGADVFLSHWKTRNPQHGPLHGEADLRVGARTDFTLPDGRTVLAAKTAADGTFELTGMGADRVVTLFARGPGIADAEVLVVNRANFDPAEANRAAADNFQRTMPQVLRANSHAPTLSSPTVTIVAEQEKIVRGVVKDRDTGKPRPGVEVSFGRVGGMHILPHAHTATTDKDGRFELRGSRKHPNYVVEVPSDPQTGYLLAQAEAADTAGYQPIEVELGTAKGVVLTGKLADKETGKPLTGGLWVEPMQENPHLKTLPTMNRGRMGPAHFTTRDDGTFRVVVPPGQVLVMVAASAPPGEMFKLPEADPKYPQYFHNKWDTLAYVTSTGGYTTIRGNWCKVIDTPATEKTATLSVEFERAKRKVVRVVDADGKAVSECDATGVEPKRTYPQHQGSGTVNVYGLEAGQERQIVVCEQKRKLVGSLTVKESDADPVLTLSPGGTVTGRVVDAAGTPLAGVGVHLKHTSPDAAGVFEVLHFATRTTTDANGAFTIDAVVPGFEFRLAFSKGTKNLAAKDSRHTVAKSGGSVDVGEVKVQQLE